MGPEIIYLCCQCSYMRFPLSWHSLGELTQCLVFLARPSALRQAHIRWVFHVTNSRI